jgi:hypothetical protein
MYLHYVNAHPSISFTRVQPTHTHTYSHSHTLSLAYSITHTLTLSHTHSHSLSHTLSLSLTHTLTLSHTHSHTLSHTHRLACFLLQEKYNTRSFFKPYIETVPQHYRNMPIFFDKDELKELKGSLTVRV